MFTCNLFNGHSAVELTMYTCQLVDMYHIILFQQIMRAVKEYDLGLDVRTAAYICALQKIYNVYIAAGITF